MTAYPKDVWDQLKNTTIQKLAAALERDGWVKEPTKGATQPYRHPTRPADRNRVVLHIHPKATKSARILKGLLDSIQWSEEDLIRVKLIKGRRGGR